MEWAATSREVRTVPVEGSDAAWAPLLDALGGARWEADAAMRAFTLLAPTRPTASPHEEDRPALAELVAKREPFTAELRLLRAGGALTWGRIAATPVTDAEGALAGWRGILLDVTSHRRVEETLRASELRYSQILDSVTDLVFTRDARAVVTYANRATAEHYGVPARELRGRQDGAGNAPEDIAARARDEARVFAEGKPLEVAEEVNTRRDGERRIFHTIKAPIFDERGRVIELVGVARDVTERKSAEREAQRQSALLAAAMEAVPDGLVVVSPEGRILTSNGRFAQMWGIPAEVLATRDVEKARAAILDALAEPDAFQRRLAEIYEDPTARTHDLLKLKDGRVFDRYSAPIPAEDGSYHGRIWSFRDITDRKRAEETLSRLLAEVEAQRRRLDNIVASVPGVVWEAWGEPDAASQRIDFVSDHVEKLLGYTQEEWLRVPNFWLTIVHPDDAEEAARRARAAFDAGTGGSQQFRWRRKDGTYLWVQAWNVVVRDEHDKPVGMRGVTMDITPLKAAEAAMRASDERFRLIARATTDTIWDWDLRTNALWWNENFTKVFGYPRDEIEPDIASWTTRIHPEDLARVKTGVLKAIEGGDETWSDEYRFRRNDGAYAQILDRGFIIRDAAGIGVRMVGSMMDLTARKESEAALARLAAIVQNSEDAIYAKSLDGYITEWNPGAERLYGYARAEIVGKPIQTVVPPERVEEERGILARLARGESVPPFETVRVRKDGRRLDVSLTVSPLRDAQGRFVGASAIARDITERKRAHALISWQRRVLEKIAAGAPLPETLDLLCREAELLAPDRLYSVLLLDAGTGRLRHGAAPSLAPAYVSAIDGLEPGPTAGSCGTAAHRRAPVVVTDIAADPLWASFRGLALPLGLRACWSTPILGSHGDVLGTWAVYAREPGAPEPEDESVIGTATRLAAIAIESARASEELRTRAEALAQLAEQLQKSNRELDQFAYVTSHDLKAPLRGIANLSRWIEEDLGETLRQDTREHLELMRGRVNRMEALIDAILEYSRVGRVRHRPETVDAGVLVREVVDLLAPPPGFEVRVAPAMPSLVTERARLQQVFMNLIGNAIKHHPDKAHGLVEIQVEDAGSRWRFTVRDNGAGIAPRFHEKIFAIFQTLEARDKVEGTGIGLAIVKKVVEGYGGEVTIDSDVGRGATFRFTWPKRM